MSRPVSRVSIEQVGAFVELARCGSLRAASVKLCLSEEGLRSRILVLEERLGAALYEKERGRRGDVRLTHAGHAFLDKAIRFLEEARALTEPIESVQSAGGIKIAVSQHPTLYMLVDIVRNFRAQFPDISVRISTHTEQEVVSALRTDTGFAMGICATEEFPADLACHHWFSMGWRLITPLDNPFQSQSSVTLAELVNEPLIVFQSDSRGRQHVLEAFHQHGLAPKIVAEVPCAQVAARLVEAGLGIAIVPSLASHALVANTKVSQFLINDSISKIENVILTRPASRNDSTVQTFLDYLLHYEFSSTPDNKLAAIGKKTEFDASTSRQYGKRSEEQYRELTRDESRWGKLRHVVNR
ncbi:MAG: LysR substrate-binding domain-containing protein [Terriglobales bacterium]